MGSPRSGRTFLAEILDPIPRPAILLEPELVQQLPQAKQAGLIWHTIDDPHEEWPEGRRFFERVLHGRLIASGTVSHVPLARALALRTWIAKFVDANVMPGWLAANFPIRPPVLLFGHLCAVIAAQLWRGWSNPHPRRLKGFLPRHLQFTDHLETLRAPTEFAATLWSMQIYAPLTWPRSCPFVLITCQNLAADLRGELSRLFNAWQMPLPEGLADRALRPSGTTYMDSALRAGSDPPSAWRQPLSTAQIDTIVGVIATFSLDFYDAEPKPALARLAVLGHSMPWA